MPRCVVSVGVMVMVSMACHTSGQRKRVYAGCATPVPDSSPIFPFPDHCFDVVGADEVVVTGCVECCPEEWHRTMNMQRRTPKFQAIVVCFTAHNKLNVAALYIA